MKIEVSDEDVLKIYNLIESPEVKSRAEYLLRRNDFTSMFPSKHEKFIFEVVELSLKNGKMGYSFRSGTCKLCGSGKHDLLFKSGQRKGEVKKTWYDNVFDFKDAFVRTKDYTPYGVCKNCLPELKEELEEILSTEQFEFEWNDKLFTCPFKKDDKKICFSCKKAMYESEMARSRTFMGDGSYPSTCPNCKAESMAFGNTHQSTNNFRIIRKK